MASAHAVRQKHGLGERGWSGSMGLGRFGFLDVGLLLCVHGSNARFLVTYAWLCPGCHGDGAVKNCSAGVEAWVGWAGLDVGLESLVFFSWGWEERGGVRSTQGRLHARGWLLEFIKLTGTYVGHHSSVSTRSDGNQPRCRLGNKGLVHPAVEVVPSTRALVVEISLTASAAQKGSACIYIGPGQACSACVHGLSEMRDARCEMRV